MKVVLTFSAFILFCSICLAQDAKVEQKSIPLSNTIELVKAKADTSDSFARLYMFKNSRVKKELKFKTKRNNSKLV